MQRDDQTSPDREAVRAVLLASHRTLLPLHRLNREALQAEIDREIIRAFLAHPSWSSLLWREERPEMGQELQLVKIRPPVPRPSRRIERGPNYSFRICSGLSETLPIKDPDPLLVRAGFVLAMTSLNLRARTALHFGEILSDASFRKLNSTTEQNAYLGNELTSRLKRDSSVVDGICESIKKLGHELKIEVVECGRVVTTEH